MTKKRADKSIYLTDQSVSQLGEVVSWLRDRVEEMAVEEEWMESEGFHTLPLLRGLVAYLQQEHLEEEVDEEAEDYELAEDEEEAPELEFSDDF